MIKNEKKITIAFTWPWNTWKSTVIKKLEKDLLLMLRKEWIEWNRINKGSIAIYPETARLVLDSINDEFDMWEFQNKISALEDKRVTEIKNDMSDVLLLDRTSVDWVMYSVFNMMQGYPIWLNQNHIGEYDLIILFTEEFKRTNTEQFAHYNDERLVELFRMLMNYVYKGKVVEFANASEYDNILKTIESLYHNKNK